MSPTKFEAKREENYHPPLKINEASHFIKKVPSSSSSFSSSSPSSPSISSTVNGVSNSVRLPQRQPVIIYTHSPKVIQTTPRDFMALVQRLTGMSGSDDDILLMPSTPKKVTRLDKKRVMISGGDHHDSTWGVTKENLYCLGNNSCADSCKAQQMFGSRINSVNNIPIFSSHLSGILCSNQAYYNYPDHMLFNSFNTRNPSAFDELTSDT